ncbi:MAG: TonB-dependent receptor, partial [Acidobacteria bacterium]|nr:TonB-dependent receptor [Acidobacteriota bacterium]
MVMRTLKAVLLFTGLLLVPMSALAQGTIAGVVTDASGAILPGVTVEASSPALIEKVRTAVTGETGLYSIPNLRPGRYTVTFILPGFTSVRREGIELTGSFTATVNAQLAVGAVAETVTVTGEAAIVDIQSTATSTVLDGETINAIPSSRVYSSLAALIPGVQSNRQDVGGALGDIMNSVVAHGQGGGDTRVIQNNLPMLSMQTAGNAPGMQSLNMSQFSEMTIETSGASAEWETGGVRINLIPRDGGNQFSGSGYVAFTNDSMQGDNFTQRLRDLGLRTPTQVLKTYDLVPALGGPIRRDSVWFYWTGRYAVSDSNPGGAFYNKNAKDPTAWTYEADTAQAGHNYTSWKSSGLRVTWQATPRNKIALQWDEHDRCSCLSFVAENRSPEAASDRRSPRQHLYQGQWTVPISNRILFDASAVSRVEVWGNMEPRSGGFPSAFAPGMIRVLEQSTGLSYRGWNTYNSNVLEGQQFTANVTYVTGAHSFKTGVTGSEGQGLFNTRNFTPFDYRFNRGVPNQVTLRDLPLDTERHLWSLGMYAQDRWTTGKLTLNGAVRFDLFRNGFDAQSLGPSLLNPGRNISFPAQDNLKWEDVSYRSGAAYDVFGTGRTALRASVNKYIGGQQLNGLASDPNPILRLVTQTNRSWRDANGNYVVDCALLNPLANGECGAMSNRNFGQFVPGATYDPELLQGFGVRPYNWEFSAGMAHELLPRVSLDVAYFRRIFGNFTVTDNLAVSPSDYSRFSVTAATDPRLPGGGGQVISDLYNLNPDKVGFVDDFVTLASNYGKQTQHWNGFDVSLAHRGIQGLRLQGGFSTGKQMEDNCDVVAKTDNPSTLYCHTEEAFLTQVKLLAAYTIPVVDVQVSGTLQSLPGPEIAANARFTNADVQPSLGRPLSGGAANVTVN